MTGKQMKDGKKQLDNMAREFATANQKVFAMLESIPVEWRVMVNENPYASLGASIAYLVDSVRCLQGELRVVYESRQLVGSRVPLEGAKRLATITYDPESGQLIFERHHPNGVHESSTFAGLAVGDHFTLVPGEHGQSEYVKLPVVGTGEQHGRFLGYVNAIQVGTAQLSGMGPLVQVTRCRE